MSNLRVLNLVTDESAPWFRKQLDELKKHGVEHKTISPHDPQDKERRSIWDYSPLLRAATIEQFNNYDIVHANYGTTAPVALLQINTPVVMTLWGSDLMGRFKQLSQFCANYCNEVIVMSDEMNELLEVEATVIPFGLDSELFKPMDQTTAQLQVGWDHESKHILFPWSPNREEKNYPLAKEIVQNVNENFDVDIKLHTVFGEPHERIPYYMNAADVLLLTSNREGSPISIREALACNTPIVARPVGDIREQVAKYQNAVIGDSKAELEAGLANLLRRNPTEHTDGCCNNYSLKEMGQDIYNVYQSTL